MQPALQPRVEEARLPAETGAGDAVENGEILIFVGAGARGGFLADLRIDIGKARLFLRIDHENIGLGHAFDVDAGGRDQREAAQALGRAHRHFERDPTAKRLPDDVNAGKSERLDGIEIAVGDVGNFIDPGGRLGGAEAGMIGHDHANVSRIAGHSASPSVPWRYINGTPLPPRARLSLQPLISIVCRTNSMVHPRSRFARREKVGEVGNRLKHFLNAAPSRFPRRARGFAGSTSKRKRSTVLPIASGSEWPARYSPPEFA